jgi:hypothetical protein
MGKGHDCIATNEEMVEKFNSLSNSALKFQTSLLFGFNGPTIAN